MRLTLILLVSLSFLSGCATTSKPKQFVMQNTAVEEVWPTSPSMPRFRYLGELHGEHYRDELSSQSVLEAVIGLIRGEYQTETLKRPYDIHVTPDNKVYVADVALPGVVVFDQTKKTMTTIKYTKDDSALQAPVSVTVANQQIFVVDTKIAAIFRFDLTGKPIDSFGGDILKRPIGIAYDHTQGKLYVADALLHAVKVFDLKGNLVDTIGQLGDGESEFNFPSSIDVRHGKLYVSDTMNARVQVIPLDGSQGSVQTFGYRGMKVGNTPRPKGVAVDAFGNVLVVESYFGYLLVYNEKGEFLLPISGKGRQIGEFYLPSGVAVDHLDRVYLADMFNGRIVVLQYLSHLAQ